jgi:hypothetical protein
MTAGGVELERHAERVAGPILPGYRGAGRGSVHQGDADGESHRVEPRRFTFESTILAVGIKYHQRRTHSLFRQGCIPRARYRVQNWPQYEAGLKRRGDLTLWIDEAAIAGWQAPRRTTPGGQARYSDLAIQLVLMLRLVFHLALRQAEGFAGSVLRLLGLDLFIPDHTTLSRRGRNRR